MPSTIDYPAGELLLVNFPFTSGTQFKARPALALLDTGDADIVLARITSQAVTTRYDVSLTNWQQAGLLTPCSVRLHKVVTSAKFRVIRVLGRLEPGDRQKVSAVLQQLFGAW